MFCARNKKRIDEIAGEGDIRSHQQLVVNFCESRLNYLKACLFTKNIVILLICRYVFLRNLQKSNFVLNLSKSGVPMKHLPHQDLQLLLSAIEELNSDVDTNTLPDRSLAAATKIIDADSVAFTGISYSGEYADITWNNTEAVGPEAIEVFSQYLHEQPLLNAFVVDRTMETLRITDIMRQKIFSAQVSITSFTSVSE
jgi:hypothetical protein